MPAKREYTEETKAIMTRFFQAVDILIEHKKIRGIQTYCKLAGINRRHYYTQRMEISRGYFQISWVLPLIKEFDFSCEWLLLGKGNMFSKQQSAA
jgi:hypothetical protein